MTQKDGGLRTMFRERFSLWQWTSIETGRVSPGTPDAEYCTPGGLTGWVEFKKVEGWKITFEPLQPAWINKRSRLGGRVFVAVRRKLTELYVIPGSEILRMIEVGVKGREPIKRIGRSWDWEQVEKILTGT